MEVLDQNLSTPKINKAWAYDQKESFRFFKQPSCVGLSCKWGLMVLCTLWSEKIAYKLSIKTNFKLQNWIHYRNMPIKGKLIDLWEGWRKGNGIPTMIINIVEIMLHMLLKGKNIFCNKFIMGCLVKNIEISPFCYIVSHLKHGRPMLEYEAHKDFFDFLNFEENPKMH